MAANPEIRRPLLFAVVTLASAAAALGACFSLFGLAGPLGPGAASANAPASQAKPPKLAASRP